MKIICDAICKSFSVGKQPRITVIDHCDAQFESGKITAIVGASGVGKTTLLDILALSSIPDSGKVLYDGADSSRFNPRERAAFRRDIIGYLPQDLGLIPILTAEETFGFRFLLLIVRIIRTAFLHAKVIRLEYEIASESFRMSFQADSVSALKL